MGLQVKLEVHQILDNQKEMKEQDRIEWQSEKDISNKIPFFEIEKWLNDKESPCSHCITII